MTVLMRETWNFTGSIVSDDGAVSQVGDPKSPGNLHGHRYANSSSAAAADALQAGCDVDYGGGYSDGAQAAVDQGLITEAVVVAAVRRSLSTRMRLGEFDVPQAHSNINAGSDAEVNPSVLPLRHGEAVHLNPWSGSRLNLGVVDSPDHRALAFRAAVSSIVLLENEMDQRGLPIESWVDGRAAPSAGGSIGGGGSGGMVIAVLGEGANDTHALVNRYTGTQDNIVTVLQGIQNRAASDGVEVRYSESDVAIAAGASVVVVVVRSEPEGESHDRANLTMRTEDTATLIRLHQQWQQQTKVRRAAASMSTPLSAAPAPLKVVVVVISGGPVDTSEPARAMGGGFVTSVLAAWQPGEEGGNAIASLLWGDVDFSGALAVTVYRQRFTAAIDIANISVANRGYRYLQDDALQLYPYGYGLSYNTWAAPTLTCAAPAPGAAAVPPPLSPQCTSVSAKSMMRGRANVTVAVTVRNTGTRVGSVPVLLFAKRLDTDDDIRGGGGGGGGGGAGAGAGVRDVIWPNKWLVAFAKAKGVLPEKSQAITLTFGAEEMARWVDGAGFSVLPGRYMLSVADQRGLPAGNTTLTITA